MLKNPFFGSQGITLMELLIASVLVSVIFGGAIAAYTSSLRFLNNTQRTDMARVPEVAMEQLVKSIRIANSATIASPGPLVGTQLNLRIDQTCPGTGGVALGTPLNTPENPGDDSWWHYRLTTAGQLVKFCDQVAGTPIGDGLLTSPPSNPDSIALNNVAVAANAATAPNYPCPNPCTGGSGFRLVNPTGAGNPSVVFVHIRTTANPAKEIHTETAIGAMAKG